MVASDLQMVRVRSIAQNVRYRVYFTPSTDQYVVERWNASTNSYDPEGVIRQLRTQGNPYYQPDVDMIGPVGAIFFRPKGTASNNTIRLVSSLCSKNKDVVVNFVGRIRVN